MLKPDEDGCARDKIHPVTSAVPGPSARWRRPYNREMLKRRLHALETKAEAVAHPVQDAYLVTKAIQNNKKHGVEHSDLYVQFDQHSKAVDGLSEVDEFGIEVDFFDFGVGSHYEVLAPKKSREHSIERQWLVWNV